MFILMSEARAIKASQFRSSIFENTIQDSPIIQKSTFAYSKYNQKSEVFPDESQQFKDTSQKQEKPSSAMVKKTFNTRPRSSNSLKSSIFENENQNYRKPSPYKPKDSIVLGTDTYEFSKTKPIKPFEPAYPSVSSYERKQLEVFGIVNPKEFSESLTITHSPDPKTRKAEEMNSKVFENQKSYESPENFQQKTKNRPFTPESRKAEMRNSSIFGDKPLVLSESVTREKEDPRRKNQMFSDLFGRSVDYTNSTMKKEKEQKETL